jgi:hypothetical protein
MPRYLIDLSFDDCMNTGRVTIEGREYQLAAGWPRTNNIGQQYAELGLIGRRGKVVKQYRIAWKAKDGRVLISNIQRSLI